MVFLRSLCIVNLRDTFLWIPSWKRGDKFCGFSLRDTESLYMSKEGRKKGYNHCGLFVTDTEFSVYIQISWFIPLFHFGFFFLPKPFVWLWFLSLFLHYRLAALYVCFPFTWRIPHAPRSASAWLTFLCVWAHPCGHQRHNSVTSGAVLQEWEIAYRI